VTPRYGMTKKTKKPINSVRKPKKSKQTETYSQPLSAFLDDLKKAMWGDGEAEVTVTAETVLGFPPFYRGVKLKAAAVAGLPIKVYNAKTRAEDERHTGNIINAPSRLYGRFGLIQASVTDLELHGNSFTEIIRDDFTFDPIRLKYLDCHSVKLDAAREVYIVTEAGGKTREILPENMLHFRGLGTPLQGFSPIVLHQDSLALGLSMQKYGKYWFANNLHSWLAVLFPGTFKDAEDIQLFKEGLRAQSGLARAGEPLIIQSKATLQQLTPPSNESAQWVQGREHEAITASNIVGTPPHMVGAKISSSYNSFEAEFKRFLFDLEPILKAIEEELNLKLLTEEQKRRGSRYFEFVREGLLRADKATEIRLLIEQFHAGILTLRQVLEKMNLDTTGLDETGDVRFIKTDVQLMDSLVNPPAKPEPAPLDTEIEDEEPDAEGNILPENEAEQPEQDD
jgi:HK97 family phage portal protein